MINFKPISVDRARVQYFQALNDVKFSSNGIERERAREIHRKATFVLQHAQRMERTRKASLERAKQRRRVDWNVAVF
ncbi:MAG: hypothetical protein O6922_06290 [Chloroflexi bacterium]|nr:hypothetical protein [Chloroflexota bacterium]